jgi:hypothetical protein
MNSSAMLNSIMDNESFEELYFDAISLRLEGVFDDLGRNGSKQVVWILLCHNIFLAGLLFIDARESLSEIDYRSLKLHVDSICSKLRVSDK